MRQLLETIRIENRRIINVDYHNRRMNGARADLFGINDTIDIQKIIKISMGMNLGVYKCRIIYDGKIREVQVLPHQPRLIRSLKIVEDNEIDYSYKYADRSRLEHLLSLKGDCDDILILKNGCLTDTSFSNIVFQTGAGAWVTPSTFLLDGTMRRSLIESGLIEEAEIRPEDLSGFSYARLINCMMSLKTGATIKISDIRS